MDDRLEAALENLDNWLNSSDKRISIIVGGYGYQVALVERQTGFVYADGSSIKEALINAGNKL